MRLFTRTTHRVEAAPALLRALEEAQADAHRVRALLAASQAETIGLRQALRDVIRGIETAPLSTHVSAAELSRTVSPEGIAVKSRHVDWPPLQRAIIEAKRILEGWR